MKTSLNVLKKSSKDIRLNILRLTNKVGRRGAHVAPSLSIVEILSVLFTGVMRFDLDEFVLSKGHGGLGYYAALHQAQIISSEQLDSFEEDGGDFPGQPSKKTENGITYSSGTLGLGLSYAAGAALSAKCLKTEKKVFALLGDGELNEGSIWETVMFAAQYNLDNLIAIVDCNDMQSDGFCQDIIKIDNKSVWKSFGWNVVCCKGHDEAELLKAFTESHVEGRPLVILANTVKGKGVSFMENNVAWHHGALSNAQYEEAIAEVEAYYGSE